MLVDLLLFAGVVGVGVYAAGIDRRTKSLRQRGDRLRVRLGWAEAQLMQVRKRLAEREVAALGMGGPVDAVARSQYGEDALLWDLLGADGPSFFVEAGAYDGRTLSVSWLFEAAGWRGLLVEPIPERAEAARAARPGATVLHAALGEPGGPRELTIRVVEGTEGIDMLSHVPGSAVQEREVARQAGVRTREITAPVVTMDEALERAVAPEGGVGFLVLDVEGFEAQALRGMTLARWRPRVVVVEDNTMGRFSKAAAILGEAGYTHAGWVGVNQVFVRGDEPALVERARAWSSAPHWPNLTPRGV